MSRLPQAHDELVRDLVFASQMGFGAGFSDQVGEFEDVEIGIVIYISVDELQRLRDIIVIVARYPSENIMQDFALPAIACPDLCN